MDDSVTFKNWWCLRRRARIRAELGKIRTLSPDERLRPLARLALRCSDPRQHDLEAEILKEIAATGQEQAVPLLEARLTDLLSTAPIANGVRRALDDGNATVLFKEQVFDVLVTSARNKETSQLLVIPGLPGIPELLLRLDRSRAVAFLTGPGLPNLDDDDFAVTLGDLTSEGIELPRSVIEQWLEGAEERLRRSVAEGRKSIAMAEALALRDPERAMELLEVWLGGNYSVSGEAGELLLSMKGLPHPVFSFSDQVEELAWEDLSETWRNTWLATHLRYRLSARGWDGLIDFDDEGRLLLLPAGLRTMGAPQCAESVERFFALFGEEGIARTEREREEQIDRMGRESWDARVAAIAHSAGEREDLFAVVLRYMIKHADEFPKRGRAPA
jgi:hypothetical protein